MELPKLLTPAVVFGRGCPREISTPLRMIK
jgi:hypothetical protein